MKDTTILVADDHPLLLSGLVEELEKTGFHIVGKASNGLEALSLIQSLEPTIAILDINMPLLDGFEVIRKCTKLKTKYVFLTSYFEVGYIIKAKRLNLSGYLLKDEPFSEIYKCIQAVLNGDTYFSTTFTNIADNEINGEIERLKYLSPSERTIIRLIAQGNTTKEVGDTLSISPRTVQKHRENIAHKLDLTQKGILLAAWAKEYKDILIDM